MRNMQQTPPSNNVQESPVSWHDVAGHTWFDTVKTTLAVVGLVAIGLQLVRIVK
jgi:hypothetical protein